MIVPLPLKTGDKIGLIAPSRKILNDDLSEFSKMIISWGYRLVFSRNLFNSNNQFAGTDEERRNDFMNMVNDPEIKAIICARGGYGTVRIIDKLEISLLKEHPKWIIGYSDITVLHSLYNSLIKCESIHAAMPVNFSSDSVLTPSWTILNSILRGNLIEYEIPANKINRFGQSEGILVGGNLSVLYSLRGTNYDIDTEGKILFIEDIDEYLYHIDRIMMNFKLGGKLENLKGLIVGEMIDMNDNKIPFGKTANEIIADSVKDYSFPVAFGLEAGHGNTNLPLILGRKINMDVNENGCKIVFSA